MSYEGNDPQTGTQAAIDVVTQLHQPHPVKLEEEVVALPRGLELHSLKRFRDALRDRPERREGSAKLTTLGSFCEHVNRFKDEHSAIFASDDPTSPALVGVLDYHEVGAKGQPRFGAHRAVYRFPVSDEWKAWTRQSDAVGQRDFAEFIEEHITDVLDPAEAGDSVKAFGKHLGLAMASPTQLMALSRGLSVRVPGGFALALPVFRGGALYQLAARLRYRVSGGQVAWTVALHRADRVFTHAFEEACEEARATTDLPLFYGTPE